ncbi:unnamed protein product [Arabidopsis lyrata]|nr:unnamed protein product [Arabidopsis lyrata]
MGKRGRACVVVLGDLGRSPRMQYHALSLARQASFQVDIVAYGGSIPHEAVLNHPSIHIPTMLTMLLWFLFVKVPAPDTFLVQNPPSVPTLIAVKWASSWRRAAFVVDWHNFGYTLLALSLGRNNMFVSLYRCLLSFSIPLYLKKGMRPALVLSSTSWTPDENFGILLEAAHLYPNLLFIITGKGPEKEMYEENIKCLNLRHVAFRTMWLPAEDYPLLLGSADLGVCLHTSSSGLDLPMKVVDMFGCGLPVCSVSYSCIQELVKDGKNGLLFSSSSELADQLLILFKGFPGNCDALMSLKVGAMETGSSGRWATEWEDCAKPLITQENPSALSVSHTHTHILLLGYFS